MGENFKTIKFKHEHKIPNNLKFSWKKLRGKKV